MPTATTLQLSTPTDREIVLTRAFDAPRQLVFEALTDPALLKRWYAPTPMTECEVDLRVGGSWHYVIPQHDGGEFVMRGTFREVTPPDGLVYTRTMDNRPGETVVTIRLSEEEGVTTLTATETYESQEARDMVIKYGFERGAAASYDRLAAALAT